MHICDLPETEYVGVAVHPEELAALLNQAAKPATKFFQSGAVAGMACSCRVLCTGSRVPFEGLSRYRFPLSSQQMARQFFDFGLLPQLRYEPEELQGAEMGWEVQRGDIDGDVFVIVIAAWVPCAIEEEPFDNEPDFSCPTEP